MHADGALDLIALIAASVSDLQILGGKPAENSRCLQVVVEALTEFLIAA